MAKATKVQDEPVIPPAKYFLELDIDELEILYTLANYFSASATTLKYGSYTLALSREDAETVYGLYKAMAKIEELSNERLHVVHK